MWLVAILVVGLLGFIALLWFASLVGEVFQDVARLWRFATRRDVR
jgi:hypothetical protein